MKYTLHKAGAIILLVCAVSCVPAKQLKYFNDIDELEEPGINPRTQKIIMPFDKLYIKILSTDPQASQIFNSTDELTTGGMGNSGILGYLVDEAGDISFPFVGKINVGSLTTSQAEGRIQKALSEYISNISVTVKYIDNQVTIIGEVERQGIYPFTQDKLNIYEVIGLGGGLTRYGDRKNIILVRQEGEKIMHYKLNLSDSKISNKIYYYILPNDVIVVEPLRTVSTSYSNNTITTILSSITTLIALLLFLNQQY
jgi:polysaccharide export outer membrane protein